MATVYIAHNSTCPKSRQAAKRLVESLGGEHVVQMDERTLFGIFPQNPDESILVLLDLSGSQSLEGVLHAYLAHHGRRVYLFGNFCLPAQPLVGVIISLCQDTDEVARSIKNLYPRGQKP